MRKLSTAVGLKLAVASIVLGLGLGLKTARYLGDGDGEVDASTAARHVAGLLQPLGWNPVGGPEPRPGYLYTQQRFAKAGCSIPVVLAVLSGNGESAEIVRRDHAGNVVFIQNGQFVGAPSGFRRQAAQMWRGLERLVGRAPGQALPIMAIAPAPPTEPADGACHNPASDVWKG